jgi:hypothetical protein
MPSSELIPLGSFEGSSVCPSVRPLGFVPDGRLSPTGSGFLKSPWLVCHFSATTSSLVCSVRPDVILRGWTVNVLHQCRHAHNLYNRLWKPLLSRVGLSPNTRFHDLRFTFATLLLIKGVHLKSIQEMVGHFSITIALDTYIPRAFEHAGESSRDHGRYLRRVI